MIQTKPQYVRIAPGGQLPDISSRPPFKAVVVIEAECEPEWQREVSRWLVNSGCLYVMARGSDCESWHDSVDRVNIDQFAPGDIPDDRFIMTTWHEKESLEDVFWFAQFCAEFSYDETELTNVVILHLSPNDREAEFLELFEHSKTLAEREDGDS